MTLRTAWIIGLILSFIEPVIRFDRFEPGGMRIPVLIDASVSMRNFSPESTVLPFLDSLRSLQSRTGGRVDFEYLLFGDSTRKFTPDFPISYQDSRISGDISHQNGMLSFTDTKSLFPSAIDDGGKPLSNNMIIVSDGHWTRPRGSDGVFPRSSIYYLALPEAAPTPFVTVSHDAPETSAADSAFIINAAASGYAENNTPLVISLKEKNRVIRTESTMIERGYFTETVRFKTSNSRPGRRLYTIEASINNIKDNNINNNANSADLPVSQNIGSASFVHQTTPHFLSYNVYSAKPTLDRRYITQALLGDDFFKRKADSPDILFIFDWDSTAAALSRKLPRHAVTVFVGSLPCSTSAITAPSITVKRHDDFTFNTDLRSLPPPAEIAVCKQLPITGIKRLLHTTINTENVPILFTGKHRGTQSVFCPVRGTWRWDFWPMSSDRAENELFAFSNMILSLSKELLLDNLSDQLILYPAAPLHETDSARFFMSLPAAVPIFEPVKLSLKISGDDINIDTAINYHPTGLDRQPISLPALPPGKYAIASSLSTTGIKAAFADTFTVNKDMSELSVRSQNTQYLKQFAQPLDMGEKGKMGGAADIFDSWERMSAEKTTVTETIRLHRSRLLLGLLLLLLAAELVLRRAWGAD